MNAVVRLEFTPPEARVGSSGALECQWERTVMGRLVARWRYRVSPRHARQWNSALPRGAD